MPETKSVDIYKKRGVTAEEEIGTRVHKYFGFEAIEHTWLQSNESKDIPLTILNKRMIPS